MIAKLLLALVLGIAGGWLGTQVVYVRHNPLYKRDPSNGTTQQQTPDNAWKWWVGLAVGAFLGAAVPFWKRDGH
jgi:hypothetical protein